MTKPSRYAVARQVGGLLVAVSRLVAYQRSMKMVVARMLRSRIVRGIGANSYIQLVQTVAQLTTVAVVAPYWGLKTYGLWIVLFTVPSYLTMSDFGLASAAIVKIISLVAQGRRKEAVEIYQSIRLASLGMSAIALIIGTGIVYGPLHARLAGYDTLAGGSMSAILVALGLYGAISLQNGVTAGAFTATGGYATVGYVIGTMFAAEAAGFCLIVLAGGTIFQVTCCYLAIRIAGTIVMAIMLQRRAPWIATLRWQTSLSVLKPLLRPAAALVALTVAQALSIQGTVAMIGLISTPLAVPAFTTVRTMSRISAQAILIVNHAIMPSFNMASATNDEGRMTQLALISFATSLAMSSLIAVGMLLFGQAFIRIWTSGAVRPEFMLILVMVLVMCFNTTWQPLSNLIMSVNKHEKFSYHYVVVAGAATALCIPLIKVFGVVGAALSSLLLEMAMAFWVAGLASRLGIINWRTIPAQLVDLWKSFHTWKSRKS